VVTVTETATLKVGDQLELPLAAVTETFAILGKRGSGKSSTAVVLSEELLRAGQQVVVIDPTGVWWGLRANRDGSPSNLPVVIIGGEHADLPLAEGSGRTLAQLLVQTHQSAVLDVSDLSKAGMRRVLADFLEDLYRYSRDPLHLVVDEADLVAPQRLPQDSTRLFGALDDIVRRGRSRGLGASVLTQRPQVLSKDILAQVEVLIALRMPSPRDVAAIDEWVKNHADEEEARTVKRSLPSLPIGTAWVWSPGWLEILTKVAIRPRTTFDSSATPVPGAPRVVASLDAHLDVAELLSRLEQLSAPTRATAKGTGSAPSEEVRALRSQVSQLRAELDQVRPPTIERVPVLDEASREVLARLVERLDEVGVGVRQFLAAHSAAEVAAVRAAVEDSRAPARAALEPRKLSSAAEPAPQREDSPIRAGAERMLQALAAYHPVRLTRAQLATVARMKATGGTFSTYLSRLRTSGLLDELDGQLQLTEAGRARAGVESHPARTAAELRDEWRRALHGGAARMFDALVEAYPEGLTRSALADAVGMEVSGGTFSTYLSRLRSNGLITTTPTEAIANATLFLEPAATGGA
jgi:uncharacterized protein